jgi:hypothetical protein
MRRLALVFAMVAVVSSVEHIVLSAKWNRVVDAPRRIRRALIGLSDWRAILVGPLRLLQRQSN